MRKTKTPASELVEEYLFNLTVQLERLAYFEELFKAIRKDPDCGYSAKRLASLGEYLAQDFAHYTGEDLDQLKAEQGGKK